MPDRSDRSVLVHYHIFKNAGTSLDRSLDACFGERWSSFEGVDATDVLSASRLRAYLDARPTLRAVSSHLARPPLPMAGCAPMVMLRHPIDRARSVFQFVRRDNTQPDHRVALKGFDNYVAWSLDTPGANIVIRNYQTIHLSDASFRYPDIQLCTATDADLTQAKSLLTGWPTFGIVRDFGASCRRFEQCYGAEFPELRLKGSHENASPDGAPDEQAAIDATRAELGPALFDRLCDANRFDLELYAFAAASFRKHTPETPGP